MLGVFALATAGAALGTYVAHKPRPNDDGEGCPFGMRDASLFIMLWLMLFVLGFWVSSAFDGSGGRAEQVGGGGTTVGGGGTLGLDDSILSQIPVNVGARVGAAPF